MGTVTKKEKTKEFTIVEGTMYSSSCNTISDLRCENKDYKCTLSLTYEAFHNCQSVTIGGIEHFLSQFNDDYLRKLIDHVQKLSDKYIMIVDVHSNWVKRIVNLGYEILMNSPYESTNGSDMVIIMIKMADNPENDEVDDYDED